MFLAIINDTYTEVKNEVDQTPNEMQMTTFIRLKLHNCLKKCRLGKLIKFPEKQKEKTPNERAKGEIRQLLLK